MEKNRHGTGASSLVFRSPLRIFEVGRAREAEAAQFVLSTYGGGMVQGDHIHLDLRAGTGAKARIRSQANTHILKNDTGQETVFSLEGVLDPGAEVVFAAEPTVLHRLGVYRQKQRWRVDPASRLILQDWVQSGRSESGERYQFTRYSSELSLTLGHTEVVFERFVFEPEKQDPFNAASLGGLDHLVTLYVLGNFPNLDEGDLDLPLPGEEKRRFRPLERRQPDDLPPGKALVAAAYRAGPCLLIRLMGQKRADLQPLVDRLVRTIQDLP